MSLPVRFGRPQYDEHVYARALATHRGKRIDDVSHHPIRPYPFDGHERIFAYLATCGVTFNYAWYRIDDTLAYLVTEFSYECHECGCVKSGNAMSHLRPAMKRRDGGGRWMLTEFLCRSCHAEGRHRR
jgi:hypothetical protein